MRRGKDARFEAEEPSFLRMQYGSSSRLLGSLDPRQRIEQPATGSEWLAGLSTRRSEDPRPRPTPLPAIPRRLEQVAESARPRGPRRAARAREITLRWRNNRGFAPWYKSSLQCHRCW